MGTEVNAIIRFLWTGTDAAAPHSPLNTTNVRDRITDRRLGTSHTDMQLRSVSDISQGQKTTLV